MYVCVCVCVCVHVCVGYCFSLVSRSFRGFTYKCTRFCVVVSFKGKCMEFFCVPFRENLLDLVVVYCMGFSSFLFFSR